MLYMYVHIILYICLYKVNAKKTFVCFLKQFELCVVGLVVTCTQDTGVLAHYEYTLNYMCVIKIIILNCFSGMLIN